MRAAVLESIPAARLAVGSFPDPAAPLAPHELLVRVEACGICGTDLHIMEGVSYRPSTPFVLGHEPVGMVIEAGPEADRAWIGKRITITLFTGCGSCTACREGNERLCEELASITGVMSRNGGYAELMIVLERQAVEAPEALTSLEVAALVDAGATAANAARRARIADLSLAAVVGAGPLGLLTAELMRAQGANVVMIEVNETRAQAAEAHDFSVFRSFEDFGERPTAIVDCAGAAAAHEGSIRVLAARGHYIVAGYAAMSSFDFAPIARKELVIEGVRSGSRRDLLHVLSLAAEGRIALPSVETWMLTEINSALDELRSGRVAGKAVVLVP